MRKFFSLFAAVLFAGSMMATTYTKTAYADLKSGDVVIITEQKGDDVFAASNDKGTANAPAAVAVTVAENAITTDATNIIWTVEKDGANITFKVAEDALYCTNTNNGVRVGSSANNVFSIDAESGYLFNNGTSRFIGVYNSADFRCYTSVNNNIKDQTLAFFAVAGAPVAPDTVPTTAPAAPKKQEKNVMALVSDYYKENNLNFSIQGCGGVATWKALKLGTDSVTVFSCQDMKWEALTNWGANKYDVSAFEQLHADLWAPAAAKIKITVEALGVNDGGSGYKNSVSVDLKKGWNSVDVPLSEWPENYDFKDLRYFILEQYQTPEGESFENNPFAFANVYFWKAPVIFDPTNCAEAREAALSVEEDNELYNNGKEYTIEGYVTEIATAWSEQYKNITFWMADEKDGGKVLEAFRAVCEKEEDAPVVGDKVAVTGKLTKYGNTPEFAAKCTFVIIKDEPAKDWGEIKFTAAVAADALPADSTFVSDLQGFMAQISDTGNKMAIDANDARFGKPDAYGMLNYRLKSGGKTDKGANFITISVPEEGTLSVAVRTGSNSATDRNLVIAQGTDTLFNQIILESQAVEVMEDTVKVKVYPTIEIAVKKGDVVLTYPTGSLNFYGFAFRPIQHTYTVAGNSEALFGTTWDPANEANDMVPYVVEPFLFWEKDTVALSAGKIEFKVVLDHNWDKGAWPKDNYVIQIDSTALYNVAILFNPEAEADSARFIVTAYKVGEAVVIPTVAMHGDFTGSWKDTELFTLAEDNLSASLKLNLEIKNYEFGMRIGGSGNWTANGANLTREANSTNLAEGSGNMHINADVAGEYIFTYTFASQTLTVTYPEVGPEPLTIPTEAPAKPTAAEDDVLAIYCNHYTTNNLNFGISGWAGAYQVLDLQGTNVGYWTAMTWECIIDPAHTDDAHDVSGYKKLHVDLWAPLPAKIKFTAEAVTGGNYKDGVKVDLVQGWNCVDFVVAEWPENYDFKNLKCFVFEQYQTPAEASFEGNPFAFANIYFYDKESQGIDETVDGVKAQKYIMNGMLLIEKNGKVYTVTGQQVR